MSENDHSHDDEELSPDALAALVRTSVAPKGMDGSDNLLDLAALAASSAGAVSAPPPAAPAAVTPAPVKEAPAPSPFDAAASAPRPVAAAPAPVPAGASKKSSGPIIAVVLLLAAAGGAFAFFAMPKGEDNGSTATPNEQATAAVTPNAVAPAPAAPAAAPTEPTEAPATARPRDEHSARADNSGEPSRAPVAATGDDAPAASPSAATPSTEPTPAPAAPAAAAGNPAGGSALDDVLDNALGGRPAAGGTRTEATATAPTETAPPREGLPEIPTKDDVKKVLGGLMPGVRACAADQQGLASAAIVVRNDGTVGSASIGGSPFGGTPQGKCMEEVLKKAQFGPFKQTTFRITYPFALR